MATVADAWRPTSELERRLQETVQAGDQESYFRLLADSELLVPVPPDQVDGVLANRTQPSWPTQEEDGRVHVLVYTSASAMRACLGPSYQHFVTVAFGDIAQMWPDDRWWLAVDATPARGAGSALPIESRLPSWFVRQVAGGDGRPPQVGRASAPWEELRDQHRELPRDTPAETPPQTPAEAPRETSREEFQPANEVERELLRAAANNDHDLFLQTLAATEVLLPVPDDTDYTMRPGRPGFPWQTREVDGATVVPVFTSPERLVEAARAAGTGTEYIKLPFTVALRYWPNHDWLLAINSGSPAGGTILAQQLPGLATWADQRAAQRMTEDFDPQNDIEQRLFDAARRRDTDTFFAILLGAQVLVPAEAETPWGIDPGDPGFPWRPVPVHGRTSIQIFTSLKWMNEAIGSSRFVMPSLADMVAAWPDTGWTLVLNPGTPIDATMPGDQVRSLRGPETAATPPSASTPPPPDTPDVPVAPAVPAEPTAPAEPPVAAQPSDPGQPTAHAEPTVPGQPTAPTEPAAPAEPTVATEPTVPGQPTGPAGPTVPVPPTAPTEPATPAEPTVATEPTVPGQPTGPAGPTVPVPPTASTEPTGPGQPTVTGQPTGPARPTAPVPPTALTEPTAAADPTVATEPTGHSQPTGPAGPTAPVPPTAPAEPAASAEPTVASEPTGHSQPTGPAGPTAPVPPTALTEPTAAADPTVATEPTGPGRPTGSTGPTVPVPLTASTEPTAPAEPTVATGPTGPGRPTGPAGPTVPVPPTALTEPTAAADPTVAREPTGSAGPTVPVQPTASTEPTAPAEPIVAAEPTIPAEPTVVAQPSVHGEPAVPARSSGPGAPGGSEVAEEAASEATDAPVRARGRHAAEPTDEPEHGQPETGPSGSPEGERRLRAVPEPAFEPGNRIDQELYEAASDGDSDAFLRVLLNANVLVPIPEEAPLEVTPVQREFRWDAALRGESDVRVFTSLVRLREVMPESRFVYADFRELIGAWPRDEWTMLLNPGTRIGASLRGDQVRVLGEWAARVGLVPARPEVPPPPPRPEQTARLPEPQAAEVHEPEAQALDAVDLREPAPRTPPFDPDDRAASPTVMQKVVPHAHVPWYLEQGYDRVGGFVHSTGDVSDLQTPVQLYEALGLLYEGSPFSPADEGVYIIRWPAYCPSLYRIPFGGRDEEEMAAWGDAGWVIERPPFQGGGFAPGSAGSIREYKVDSVRLPFGAEMYYIAADRTERFVAMYDPDRLAWLRPDANTETQGGRTEAAQ
ncbi:type III secretion system (T3SS) SseB-like protein [Actinomadura pelletieri DSM 43383]|uniref:Type III secretion system (T3SS) SseB-like protein n=1 Tax=Actinomadura pelletieri DSM 43383 TaxID=1120940 RepID=A0A495QU93_9ACTN|nr:SseB family protein [Actinomadura pelletieri]RKS77086.1 type III secretion system (T3SS) SseB-like protein [Actinomadura pelletieri DSM 43383]